MEKPVKTDVVIIGAGPVGLFSVFECGMLGLKCHVVDSLPEIGGQCTALYPEKPIYDIPGFPSINAGALIENLEKQAAPFNPQYHLGVTVSGLTKTNCGWKVITSSNTTIECSAVIIAAGAGAFGPNRPPLDGIEAFENKSVFYMVKRRDDFKDKIVMIAGGGDSAIDWANSLSEVASKIYLVHRRDKFRAAPDSIEKMNSNPKIEKIIPAQLHSLAGKNGAIESVTLSDLEGEKTTLRVDCLLPFFGLAASLGPIAEWGLNVENHVIPVNQQTAETAQAGIYAVGDIAAYPHKLKLILTGFAESAQAAHHIWHQLHPNQELHQEYSTTKGIPN